MNGLVKRLHLPSLGEFSGVFFHPLTIHSDFTTVTYEQAIIISVAGSTFLHLLEELRRVGESFTGSLVLFSVPDPLQTYRWLALLKLLYFFEGEETLVLKH